MKEQEKQLLLKDLCARLPYGAICYNSDTESDFKLCDVADTDSGYPTFDYGYGNLETVKPYLRPMSDLTFEEFKKIHLDGDILYNADDKIVISESWETVDYMNEIMIDYRGLIKKGLALKAPEGMYKTKTE